MDSPSACPHPASLRLLVRIVLLIASLALPSAASAQTTANGTIEGRVLNTRNGEFLENARITIEGTALVVLTDATGQYRFLNVPVGVVKVRAFFTGLDHEQVQRGKSFVAGVVDRVGEHRLSDLAARPGSLPTPAELDAPGLWVARLELDA